MFKAEADAATVSLDAAKAGKLSRGFQDCEQIGSFEKSRGSRTRSRDCSARTTSRPLTTEWFPEALYQGAELALGLSRRIGRRDVVAAGEIIRCPARPDDAGANYANL